MILCSRNLSLSSAISLSSCMHFLTPYFGFRLILDDRFSYCSFLVCSRLPFTTTRPNVRTATLAFFLTYGFHQTNLFDLVSLVLVVEEAEADKVVLFLLGIIVWVEVRRLFS